MCFTCGSLGISQITGPHSPAVPENWGSWTCAPGSPSSSSCPPTAPGCYTTNNEQCLCASNTPTWSAPPPPTTQSLDPPGRSSCNQYDMLEKYIVTIAYELGSSDNGLLTYSRQNDSTNVQIQSPDSLSNPGHLANCPDGWTQIYTWSSGGYCGTSGTGTSVCCQASATYTGTCDTQSNFEGYDAQQKQDWAQGCDATWTPAEPAEDQWLFRHCGPSSHAPFNVSGGSFDQHYQQYYIEAAARPSNFLKCTSSTCSIGTIEPEQGICSFNDPHSFYLYGNESACGIAMTAPPLRLYIMNEAGSLTVGNSGAAASEVRVPPQAIATFTAPPAPPPPSNIMYAESYGSTATCPAGLAVSQYCGSGENANCDGNYGWIQCDVPFDQDMSKSSYTIQRTDVSETSACDANFVITSICFSGKNSDCDGFRSVIGCTPVLGSTQDPQSMCAADPSKGDDFVSIVAPAMYALTAYCNGGENQDCTCTDPPGTPNAGTHNSHNGERTQAL